MGQIEHPSDEAVFLQADGVVFHDLEPGAGGVLLVLETGAYHGVNDVGARIWRLLDGRRTVADLARALQDELPDAPPQVGDDVRAFLTDLEARSLVRQS
jgi:hypothetical protein